MEIQLDFNQLRYKADLSTPIDISMPMRSDSNNPSAWYVAPPQIEPVRTEQFTGSVKEGGSVNFRNIFFNPHGHGTHTECVGHIAEEVYSINKHLKQFFFFAELLTITPEETSDGDKVIRWEQLKKLRKQPNTEAIIIRTAPNTNEKLQRQYSNTNPPYVEAEAMTELIAQGVNHFLIDLPSVDREMDDGVLAAHHAFWEHPNNTNLNRTITELIYVPSIVVDGLYLLNIQIASFENDATPSKPVLYQLNT